MSFEEPADPSVGQAGAEQPIGQAADGPPVGQAGAEQPIGQAADGPPVGQAGAEQPTGEATVDNPVGLSPQERVRRLVAGLDGIEGQPLAEHAERYGAVHTQLQAALSEIDGPAGG